jgi:S1-C subfamily serine protease
LAKAFEDAARRLALDQGFRNAVRKGRVSARPGRKDRKAAPSRRLRIVTRGALGSPFSQARWKARVAATVTIPVSGGHGSGFFISRSGLVITNQHVVGNVSRVSIRLSDGRNIVGRVIARNRARDVALIQTSIRNIRPIPVRSGRARIGEVVYAIGSPVRVSLQSTVSKGIVSTIRRERNGKIYIQSDVNIRGGSSGGPLIDRYGNAIGITVSTVVSNGLAVGINMFIPIREAIAVLRANTTN